MNSTQSISKRTFPDISPRAWEHPADQAALNALRRVPGLGIAVRTILGQTTERSLRLIYLASAVRVNPRQFSRVYEIAREVNSVFGVSEAQVPEIYVSQSPFLNAGAVGWHRPFIVINSSTIDLFSDDDELAGIYGHELGHILSGHVLYKTLLTILLQLSTGVLSIPLSGMALTGLVLALREWDRKSELSADRAGLLTTQSLDTSQRILMKLAGGSSVGQMNLEEFRIQADEYYAADHAIDRIFKMFNLLNQTHPFAVLRVVELQKWAHDENYATILSGQYLKGEPQDADLSEDLKSEGESHSEDWKAAQESVRITFQNFAKRAKTATDDASQILKGVFNRKTDSEEV